MLKVSKFGVFAIVTLQLCGCATAVRGTTETYWVITDPPGATVTTTRETRESERHSKNNPSYQKETYGCAPTPCDFDIARRSTFIAKVSKPDFVPVFVTVRSRAMTHTVAQNSIGTAGLVSAGSFVSLVMEGGATVFVPTSFTVATVGMLGLSIATPALAIDAVSGSMLNLYPNPLSLKLVPRSESDLTAIQIDQEALEQALRAREAVSLVEKKSDKSDP